MSFKAYSLFLKNSFKNQPEDSYYEYTGDTPNSLTIQDNGGNDILDLTAFNAASFQFEIDKENNLLVEHKPNIPTSDLGYVGLFLEAYFGKLITIKEYFDNSFIQSPGTGAIEIILFKDKTFSFQDVVTHLKTHSKHFIGTALDDIVFYESPSSTNSKNFYTGPGNDTIKSNSGGTIYPGEGNDDVITNKADIFDIQGNDSYSLTFPKIENHFSYITLFDKEGSSDALHISSVYKDFQLSISGNHLEIILFNLPQPNSKARVTIQNYFQDGFYQTTGDGLIESIFINDIPLTLNTIEDSLKNAEEYLWGTVNDDIFNPIIIQKDDENPVRNIVTGPGNDTVSVIAENSRPISINGGPEDDTLSAEANSSYIVGGSGNDHLFSKSFGSIMRGNDGNDTFLIQPTDNTITDVSPEFSAISFFSIEGGQGNDRYQILLEDKKSRLFHLSDEGGSADELILLDRASTDFTFNAVDQDLEIEENTEDFLDANRITIKNFFDQKGHNIIEKILFTDMAYTADMIKTLLNQNDVAASPGQTRLIHNSNEPFSIWAPTSDSWPTSNNWDNSFSTAVNTWNNNQTGTSTDWGTSANSWTTDTIHSWNAEQSVQDYWYSATERIGSMFDSSQSAQSWGNSLNNYLDWGFSTTGDENAFFQMTLNWADDFISDLLP